MTASNRIISTKSLGQDSALRIKNPMGPEGSDVLIHGISQQSGLQRQVVSLARLSPGKSSFLPHAHMAAEEFVFILEGEGLAIFNDEEHPVGPGDFIGYPCDGVAHQLRNTGEVDLVYLMGGERPAVDVARFPSIKKVGVFSAAGVSMIDDSGETRLQFSDYLVQD